MSYRGYYWSLKKNMGPLIHLSAKIISKFLFLFISRLIGSYMKLYLEKNVKANHLLYIEQI